MCSFFRFLLFSVPKRGDIFRRGLLAEAFGLSEQPASLSPECVNIISKEKGDKITRKETLLEGADLIALGAGLAPQSSHGSAQGTNQSGIVYDPSTFWLDSGFHPEAPVDPGVDKALEESGIDQVLAYYLPISIHGSSNWGIRYLRSPMQSYINKHFREVAKREPNADYGAVSRMIFESVRRHELEHCVQEMTYLAARPYALSPRGYSSIISQASLGLEPLASNFEVTDTPSTIGSRRLKNIVTIYLSDICRPHPYSQWNTIDVNQTELLYELEVQSLGGSTSMKSVRSKLLKAKGTGLILIPEIVLP